MSPCSSSALLKTWGVELLGGWERPQTKPGGRRCSPDRPLPAFAHHPCESASPPPSETTSMAGTEILLPSRLRRQDSGPCLQ